MRLAFTPHAFVLSLALALPAAAGTGTLRITEILAGPTQDWDGSGAVSSRDDEWIELKNTGPTAIDLSAYFLSDGDSIPRCGLSGTLLPGERRVVFGADSYAWERAHDFPAFGLSLGNSGDEAILWEVAGGETLRVDGYAFKSHEAAADRSVGRLDDDGAWELFDGLNPYTGTLPPQGNRCGPTPRQQNQCGATGTRPITWGRVKSLYR